MLTGDGSDWGAVVVIVFFELGGGDTGSAVVFGVFVVGGGDCRLEASECAVIAARTGFFLAGNGSGWGDAVVFVFFQLSGDSGTGFVVVFVFFQLSGDTGTGFVVVFVVVVFVVGGDG